MRPPKAVIAWLLPALTLALAIPSVSIPTDLRVQEDGMSLQCIGGAASYQAPKYLK